MEIPSSTNLDLPLITVSPFQDARLGHDVSRTTPTAGGGGVIASTNTGTVQSSGSNSGSEMGKFIVPSERNFVSQQIQQQQENKENAPSSSAPTAKDHQTPSSTPTSARKNRRRSNLFTPSKKSSDDKGAPGSNSNGTSTAPGAAGSAPDQPQMGSGRCIPIRQGYLYKKSSKSFSKDWKKKYVTLSDDFRLTYHPSLHDYMENVHGKEVSLQYVTVKVPGQRPRGSRNTVPNSASTGNASSAVDGAALSTSANFKNTEKVMLTGYELIKEPSGGEENNESSAVVPAADKSLAETPNVKKRHRRMKSNGVKSSSGNADCDDSDMFEFHIVSLDNKQWYFEASSAEERDEWVAAIEQQILNSLQVRERTPLYLTSVVMHLYLFSGKRDQQDEREGRLLVERGDERRGDQNDQERRAREQQMRRLRRTE